MTDTSQKLINLLDEQTQHKLLQLRQKMSALLADMKIKLENYSMGIEEAPEDRQQQMRDFYHDVETSLASITQLINTEIEGSEAAEAIRNSDEMNQKVNEILDQNLSELSEFTE